MLPFRLLCLSLALLAVAASASANETSEISRLLGLSLEDLINTPVVTASRQVETRSQSPAHIMVITREQIRERRYRNLADLMEDLPGVDFMRGTKSSAYNNFAVQGYNGSNKMLVMLDGVRVGHPAGGTFPIAENFSLFPAKQVEILYGPAAALYGADAVAGVINIITDHAADLPGAKVSLSGGNFDNRDVSFIANVKNADKLALSVGGHWQQSDRAPLDQFYPADFPKVDAGTILAADREDYVGEISNNSLYARLDVGDDLTFGYYRNQFRSLTSTGDKPATAIYAADAFWDTVTDTLYGKYRFELTPRLSGELVVDYSVQEIDPNSKYVNFYTGFVDGYEYARGERLAIEQNLNWKIDERHRVLAGLGYQKYSAIEAHSLPSPYNTSLSPNAQGLFYRGTTVPINIYHLDFDNISLYTQLQSQWSETFSTMAGVRHDQHSEYDGSVNARLGAVWHPQTEHYFKLLYGEAFRAPSPEEGLSSFGSFTEPVLGAGYVSNSGFRMPNFDLTPEMSKTLSLTWDWRPRPELNVVANAYHSRIKNLIVTGSSSATSLNGATLISPETKINAGEETHTGLDLMAQYRFQISPAWSGDLWSSASWVTGKIDEGNGVDWDLSYIADHKLKLGATLRYLDHLTITPQILWIGDTNNGRKVNASPPSRRSTPGYTLTNIHIGWHKLFDGKASAWLDINNLFDKRYYAAHGSGSLTFFDMPQQPRSWSLSLEYPF